MQGLPKLKAFLSQHTYVQAIATCRRVANGGKFKGSLASQVEVLTKAAEAGCQYVDLDLQSAQALKAAEIQKLRDKSGTRTLLPRLPVYQEAERDLRADEGFPVRHL